MKSIPNTLAVIIFAKGDSERVEKKNMREFAEGKSLVQLKVEQLNSIGLKPFVSTDSDELWDSVKHLKCARLKQTQYPGITISEVYAESCNQINAEMLMMTNCTSPLVKPETYKKIIDDWKICFNEYSSLATCNWCHEFLWSTATGKPVNYDDKKQPRSQDLRDIVEINWAAVITRREDVLKNGSFLHYPAYLYNIDKSEALDIDTIEDFKLAQIQYEGLHGND